MCSVKTCRDPTPSYFPPIPIIFAGKENTTLTRGTNPQSTQDNEDGLLSRASDTVGGGGIGRGGGGGTAAEEQI
jgi:hypothetical protein